MTFDEIHAMIMSSINKHWYSGATKEIKSDVLKCATKIYIAQMKLENGETKIKKG